MGPEFAPPPPKPPTPSASYPPYDPEPPRSRRLMRSRRERMWAGVAGGMAEYFDLDPNLVRLLWVVATVLSHGAGVAVYILFWVILPREDRAPDADAHHWRDWSEEFHSETQRLAEEARRVADDMRGADRAWRAPTPAESAPSDSVQSPATAKTSPAGYPPPPPASPSESAWPPPPEPVGYDGPIPPAYAAPVRPGSGGYAGSTPPEPAWWAESQRDVDRHRGHGRHPRSTGIVLVTLGVVLLAANAGVFSWIDWPTMWPVIFIGLGVILLARRSGWGR
jgi:phage shock protein C